MDNLKKRRYYHSFDTIKGICVLITVVIGHYWQFTPGNYWFGGDIEWSTKFANWAQQEAFKTYSLMELLFIISGIQMAGYVEKIASKKVEFSEYITGRIKRLFPASVISTIVFILGVFLYEQSYKETWYGTELNGAHIIENLFSVQSWVNVNHTLNGPLWYLSVYFLCLILFFFYVKIGCLTGMNEWALWIPMLFGMYITDKGYDYFLVNGDIARGLYGFFFGVLLAFYLEKLGSKYKIPLTAASVASIIIWIIVRYKNEDLMFQYSSLSRVSVCILFLYTPLIYLIYNWKMVDKIIGFKPLSAFGRVSIYAYAMNFPFYVWIRIFEHWTEIEYRYETPHVFWGTVIAQIVLAFILNAILKPGTIPALVGKLKDGQTKAAPDAKRKSPRPASVKLSDNSDPDLY